MTDIMHCMNSNARKVTSYKYAFFKCILDNLFNATLESDGIWACASLLHILSQELNDVFKRCSKALKSGGVMYCSFKYGEFEGLRNGRYYLDLNEQSFETFIKETNLAIKDIEITTDVRPDRSEKWLNVILNKTKTE